MYTCTRKCSTLNAFPSCVFVLKLIKKGTETNTVYSYTACFRQTNKHNRNNGQIFPCVPIGTAHIKQIFPTKRSRFLLKSDLYVMFLLSVPLAPLGSFVKFDFNRCILHSVLGIIPVKSKHSQAFQHLREEVVTYFKVTLKG